MRIKRLIVSSVTLMLILAPIFSVTAKVFEKPEVTVKSVTINSVGLKKIDMTLFLNISNPNAWGIDLKKVAYKVNINNVENVANGITEKAIKIAKESNENVVEIPVSINNNTIFPTFKSIIKSPEKINYSASGQVFFSTFIGDIPIPFSKASEIDNTETLTKIKQKIKSFSFFSF